MHPFWISDKAQWKQDKSQHGTAFHMFLCLFSSSAETQQDTHLFVPQRRVKQYLHEGNSIKQTFHDPNCICRASGRWSEDGWQMVKTSNLGDLWSLLRSIIVTQADPITMKYSTPCGSTSCLPYG